jgi:hypothetical protein
MLYNKINEFCKVKNLAGAHKNGTIQPPRFKWIVDLCDREGLEYEIIEFDGSNRYTEENKFFNLYLKGTSNKMFIAHHDIVNPNSENANDNSASVINCLSIKKLHPEVNIAIIDGEEPPNMGTGSTKLAHDINDGYFGNIEWVLNLELTGKGGTNFFVGNYRGPLFDKLIKKFNPPVVNTPFNDSIILRKYGIDSTVVTTLPLDENGELDMGLMWLTHSMEDNLSTIDPKDMKEFVEKVVLKLL